MVNSEHAIPHMMSAISLLELHLNQELSEMARNSTNSNILEACSTSETKIYLLKTAKKSLDKMKIYADLASQSIKNQEISSYVDNMKKFYGFLSFIKPIIVPTSLELDKEAIH